MYYVLYLDPNHVVGVTGSCRQFLGEVGVDIFFSGKDSSLPSLKSQKTKKLILILNM
jgi:hypothetical protein